MAMAFIVFEGIDGAGKSTLIDGLCNHLRDQDKSFLRTREPGGSSLGPEIRNLLLRSGSVSPSPRAELLLYEAERAQHVSEVILPALNNKKWVVCDRFTASSIAFQGGGRDIPEAHVEWLNNFATDGLKPDLTVLLDIDLATAQARMKGRELDRLEIENQEFHEKVRQSYLRLAQKSLENWLVLSAENTVEFLMQQLLAHLKSKKFL